MVFRSLSRADTIASQHHALAQRRHHTRMPHKRLRNRGLRHPRLSLQGLHQLVRYSCNARTESISTLASAAPEATGTARLPATCCVRASKCNSASTVSPFVSQTYTWYSSWHPPVLYECTWHPTAHLYRSILSSCIRVYY